MCTTKKTGSDDDSDDDDNCCIICYDAIDSDDKRIMKCCDSIVHLEWHRNQSIIE